MENSYLEDRKQIINEMQAIRYGQMKITANDIKATNSLDLSQENAFKDFPDDFYFSLAMKYKSLIEKHPFFQKLNELPKGALLHHHMLSAIDPEWFLSLLDDPCVYEIQANFDGKSFDKLIYNKAAKGLISLAQKKGEFLKSQNFESKSDGETAFRAEIKKKLGFLPEEVEKIKNNDKIWDVFLPKYFYGKDLVQYKENYKQHILNVFNQCINDKLLRLETRVIFGQIRNENFEIIPLDEEMEIYQNCLKKFRETAPYFSLGMIVEVIRNMTDEVIRKKVREAYSLKKKYPELIVGFDFDGNENKFRSFYELSHLIIDLRREYEKEFEVKLPLILHCGESLKYTNQNPIDGCLLDAKRLGHGINVLKFPYLLEIIKKKNICIEINPISNQTLKNTLDLRWHPGIIYFGMGIKIAISNDDPTLYGTKGINYDLFVATAAFELNLLDLKKIFLNSIECSTLETKDRDEAIDLFLKNWDEVISNMI